MHHSLSPIIALCTPRGAGALALLRLSGSGACTLADRFCRLVSNNKIDLVQSHTVHYATVIDAHGTVIDRVLCIVMREPHTFTGQDTVEISCHNNDFIIEAIIQAAIAHGARPAQPGEFSQRAFLNNKIDLIQAEAIHELIQANTQQALKKSLAQVSGTLSAAINTLEHMIIRMGALSQASFEFIDEQITFAPEIDTICAQAITHIDTLQKNFNQQQRIRQGMRIALIGLVNAGKSSLFNALLKSDRAIVTPIAGTTRDILEASIYRNQQYYTLVDTAGIRQTADSIEKEGIRRSHEQAHIADIILLVTDESIPLTQVEHELYEQIYTQYMHKTIRVYTKADLYTSEHGQLCVSSITNAGLDALEKLIEQKVHTLYEQADSPFLLSKRQFNILLDTRKNLEQIHTMLHEPVDYELVAYELEQTLTHIHQLTGKTASEQIMNAVFKEFCVGK